MKTTVGLSRTAAWIAALTLSVFTYGCGGGGGGGTPAAVVVGGGTIAGAPAGAIAPAAACPAGAGAAIPTVTQSSPVNGDLLVSTSTTGVANSGKSIAATFSLPMNAATINTQSFTLTRVGGAALTAAVTVNASSRVATLTTTAALLPSTSYTAVISTAATAANGNQLACAYAFNFTTAAAAGTAPAPIALGLATPFAIASSGGITNAAPAGSTKINGDVVLNPNQTCNAVAVGAGNNFGLCGGTPPINNPGDRVITQIFPDTTTADAVIVDMKSTFNNLAPAALPGATVLGCGVIGSAGGAGAGVGCAGNATLPPGVYISATSSSIGITGTLTLDAAGNPNAVWVFQAPSTLTVNTPGAVVLTGGAKASNVWWYVGSSATLNGGVVMNGNILASATISLGTLATSCGRLLSGAAGAGSLTMLSNTVSVPGHANAPVTCQ
jgi:hypothetical protein